MRQVMATSSPPAAPPKRPRARPLPDTLVLSGGGLKGVATMGALDRLQAAGMLAGVRTVVGTSAGALVGALVATRKDLRAALDVVSSHGYSPDFDFERLAREFGLDNGQCIYSLARAMLGGDPGLTLADVRRLHGISLVVCVTNVSRRAAEYLGPDTHPDMPLLLAIRMSCSVPLYFSAVRYGGEWFVDGSLVDNFPCNWALDHGGTHVLGISTRPVEGGVASLESFLGAVVESVASSRVCDRADILDLRLPGVSSLHFGAPPDAIAAIFRAGADQASAFVKKRV